MGQLTKLILFAVRVMDKTVVLNVVGLTPEPIAAYDAVAVTLGG